MRKSPPGFRAREKAPRRIAGKDQMQQANIPKRKGGRPTSAATARLSEAILAAAQDAFLAAGFSGASVEAIAAAAGTTKQTIYARFGSKERLFVAVSDALLKPKFAAKMPGNARLREKLIAVAGQILDAMLNPQMVRMSTIITTEAWRFPDLARAADSDEAFPGRQLIMDVLAEAMAAGEIRTQDIRPLMLLFQDMLLATPLRSAALGLSRFDGDGLARWTSMAVDIFLEGCRPAAAPEPA